MRHNTTALTIGQQRAREIAAVAAKHPEGITCRFINENYPSPAACKQAARSLQANFNSVKSKERRAMKAAMLGTPGFNPVTFQNDLDKLGAFMSETDYGWEVRIVPAEDAFGSIEIVSAGTGEPLKEFTEEYGRWDNLAEMLGRLKYGEPCPLTEEEVKFFWSYNPEVAKRVWDMNDWEVPAEVQQTA